MFPISQVSLFIVTSLPTPEHEPVLRRLFHGDHLLPELLPLTSLGITDGSPVTVALSSPALGLGKHVKVVIGAWAGGLSCFPSILFPFQPNSEVGLL